MLSRFPAALARGLLVAVIVVFPGIALPGLSADAQLMALFVALCAMVFITIEYVSESPSLVQFRSAPPLNRIRFAAMSVTVVLLVFMLRDTAPETKISSFAQTLGAQFASVTDVPFSPVRMIRQLVSPVLSEPSVALVTKAAALAYGCAALSILAFLLVILRGGWPFAGAGFNIWVNLPTFDPVGRGDPVERLRQIGAVNLLLGIIAPFLIPAILAYSAGLVDLSRFEAPNSLIWIVTIWAFAPASFVMRGIALLQIARLVQAQRRAVAQAADGERLSMA